MTLAAGYWSRRRPRALLALAIPTLAGIGYLAAFGAPLRMVAVNSGALLAGLLLVAFAPPVRGKPWRHSLYLALLALLALPLVLGPQVGSVARWLSFGGFPLHVGMLVIPLLCALVASDKPAAPILMLTAQLITFAQPDMASCLALTIASFGLWLAGFDWKMGAVAALGLFASLGASFAGALPPQEFVEGVLESVWQSSPLGSAGLLASLAVSILALLLARQVSRATRYALSGALVGFVLAALLGPYPFPLIGYGAAPIFGLALALSFGSSAPEDARKRSCPPSIP